MSPPPCCGTDRSGRVRDDQQREWHCAGCSRPCIIHRRMQLGLFFLVLGCSAPQSVPQRAGEPPCDAQRRIQADGAASARRSTETWTQQSQRRIQADGAASARRSTETRGHNSHTGLLYWLSPISFSFTLILTPILAQTTRMFVS